MRGPRITPEMSPGTVNKIKEDRKQRRRDVSNEWHSKFAKKGAPCHDILEATWGALEPPPPSTLLLEGPNPKLRLGVSV